MNLHTFILWIQVSVVDAEAYTYEDEVIKKAEAMGKPGLVEIYQKEDNFIFTVESTGAIKASQLFLNAIQILKQKLDAVRLAEDIVEVDDFGELGAIYTRTNTENHIHKNNYIDRNILIVRWLRLWSNNTSKTNWKNENKTLNVDLI